MKRISSLIAAVMAAFALSGTAYAVPQIYRFDGQINSLSYGYSLTGGGAFDNTAVGRAISYSFIIDTELSSSSTSNGVSSNPGCAGVSCYYAQYLSGGVAGSGPAPYNYTGLNSYNQESNYAGPFAAQGLINVSRYTDNGFNFDHFEISTYAFGAVDTATISHWVTGVTPFTGFNVAFSYTDPHDPLIPIYNSYTRTEVWSSLTLTSICPQQNPNCGSGQNNTVPEPSTLLLLGSGMVGLAMTRLRKFRKKG